MITTHYLYTPKDMRAQADEFVVALEQEGYKGAISYLDYNGGQWAIAVTVDVADVETSEVIEDHLVDLADAYGIEYDGSETTSE